MITDKDAAAIRSSLSFTAYISQFIKRELELGGFSDSTKARLAAAMMKVE